MWVPGAGFFLNNEMDDFAAKPGTPNQFGLVQGEANAIAPGKRPLSAMAPTIVLDTDGSVLMLVGGRGGPRIITAVVQAIVNVIDHHMSLADALGAPRIHDQALPDRIEYEKGGVSADVVEALEKMGYQTKPGGTGTLTAIRRVSGGWEGMVDPRATGWRRGIDRLWALGSRLWALGSRLWVAQVFDLGCRAQVRDPCHPGRGALGQP